MFKNSNWSHTRTEDNIIIVNDLNGLKSVTNDMENVLAALLELYPDLAECKVIYEDSMGIWDRVLIKHVRGTDILWSFAPITPGKRIEDEETAIDQVRKAL